MLEYDFLDIRALDDGKYDRILSMMTDRRRERAERLSRPEDRRRTLAAEWLARTMAARRFGIPIESAIIENEENGRPVLCGLPAYISLSHSGSYAMCAICEVPVGADIEVVSERGMKLVGRICTPEEQLFVCPDGKFDPARFTQVWTGKEAVLKHSGKGLSGGIGSVAVADSSGMLAEINELKLISGRHEEAAWTVVFGTGNE